MLKRVVVLAVLGACIWYAVTRLGVVGSPAQAVYRRYLYARIYMHPADARSLAIGPAQDGVPEISNLIITKHEINVTSDVLSADGRRRAVGSTTTVCVRSDCSTWKQAATMCNTDDGWRVCNFAEYPVAPSR